MPSHSWFPGRHMTNEGRQPYRFICEKVMFMSHRWFKTYDDDHVCERCGQKWELLQKGAVLPTDAQGRVILNPISYRFVP